MVADFRQFHSDSDRYRATAQRTISWANLDQAFQLLDWHERRLSIKIAPI
jgi:hypothetical protein